MKGLRNLKSTAVKPNVKASAIDSRLSLDEVLPRENDTRSLNESHIESLAESIAAVGLIQPLAVDNQGRLLAGGHRLAAIIYLKETNQTAFEQWFSAGIPVHHFDFDAEAEPELALAVEVSENEQRRSYSVAEVKVIAERLAAAGFRQMEGRPKKGEKALLPALSVIVGKSKRTLLRYLNDDGSKKTVPRDTVFTDTAPKAVRSLSKLVGSDGCPDDIKKAAERLLKKIQKELTDKS